MLVDGEYAVQIVSLTPSKQAAARERLGQGGVGDDAHDNGPPRAADGALPMILLFLIGIMLTEVGLDSLVEVVGAFLSISVVGPLVGFGDGGSEQSTGV